MAEKKSCEGDLLKSDKELVRFVPRWTDMVVAIEKCHSTDEAKSIRDKAMALEVYARQALNFEAEQKARDIRIRAERRSGELLREVERQAGGDRKSNQKIDRQHFDSKLKRVKESAGISDDQARRWQKLADIPKKEFEERLKEGTTTSALIEDGPKYRQLPPMPLWLYGVLLQFEQREVFRLDINKIVAECTEAHPQTRNQFENLIGSVGKWLSKFSPGAIPPKREQSCNVEEISRDAAFTGAVDSGGFDWDAGVQHNGVVPYLDGQGQLRRAESVEAAWDAIKLEHRARRRSQ